MLLVLFVLVVVAIGMRLPNRPKKQDDDNRRKDAIKDWSI
jgi:hypothetical protein